VCFVISTSRVTMDLFTLTWHLYKCRCSCWGSIWFSILYNFYFSHRAANFKWIIRYANDKTTISIWSNDPLTASKNLKSHLDRLVNWFTKLCFKDNQKNKSVHTTFLISDLPHVRIFLSIISSFPTLPLLIILV